MDVQLSLVSSDIYSIDTNVFLDIWCPPEGNIYSKHRMPELWQHIEKLVDEGRIIATKEVHDELVSHASSDLLTWINQHKSMFIMSDMQIEYASDIINRVYVKYKNGYKPEVKDAADPFVVAAALACGGFVLSQEQGLPPRHDPKLVNSPKIPTVCDEYKLQCFNIDEFISKEGFQIRMVTASGTATEATPPLAGSLPLSASRPDAFV